MLRAVVFGASGQLGSATAEHLLASGWRVFAVTRGGRRLPLPVEGAVPIDGDGKTRAQVIQELGRAVDAVFDPTSYTHADALDLISAESRFGAVVAVSSSSVYADNAGRSLDEAGQTGFPEFDGPICEDTATVPPGPSTYSTRKIAMERALLHAGVPATILRPCAIYGRYATHPREWWFIKRALDRRPAIPVAFNGDSVFHTSSAQGIAALAGLCMTTPSARVLNVADDAALPVRDIAGSIEAVTGLFLPITPLDGPAIGASYVGGTPWSAERPYILDTSRARALGWTAPDYRNEVGVVCEWVLGVARTGDWRSQFRGFTNYGYDPFDYAEEDRVFKQLGSLMRDGPNVRS